MTGLALLNPWGLLGLAALGGVLLVYLFYERFKERIATGLFLWDAPAQAARSGRRLNPPYAGRSFWLDCLAAVLAALALAAPAWQDTAPAALVLVLDESLSLRAHGNAERVRREAGRLLAAHGGTALIISAGIYPRVLTDFAAAPAATRAALAAWEPFAPRDSVAEAVRLAEELASGRAQLHVFTDRAETPPAGRLETTCHRVRGRGDNLALVEAERRYSSAQGGEQLYLCAANYGARPVAAELRVSDGATTNEKQALNLDAGEVHPFTFALPAGCGRLQIALDGPGDDLPDDSKAILLPEPPPLVRAGLRLSDPETAGLVRRALQAAAVEETPEPADLWITDAPHDQPSACRLRFVRPTAPVQLTGPWVVDLGHPLCRELQLDGVYWAAAADWRPPQEGTALIACGEIPLLTAEGENAFALNLDPVRSNLARTPAWPVLIDNLASLAARQRPGLRRNNYRSGEIPQFNWPREATEAPDELAGDKAPHRWTPGAIPPPLPVEPGEYVLRREQVPLARLQINAFAPVESDLRGLSDQTVSETQSGRTTAEASRRTVSLAGLCLLLAALLALLNWRLEREEG